MNMKTRIAKFLITLTSFTVMTSVNAYQGSDCCNPCNPCCTTFDPCCPSPNRCFYGEVDYIYWAAHQDGLTFTQTGIGEACCEERHESCGCGSSSSDRCRNIDHDWNSGFKVGAGMANPCCDWEFFVQYTYYQANPKRHHERRDCDLFPVWGYFDDFLGDAASDFDVTLDRADSCWKLNFNNIDALITNEFCVNNCFTFRPSFGLKGAWIQQKFNVLYAFDDDVVGITLPDGYDTHHRQRFWGVGPKFALTASATLFESFSLYGNLGFSTLWGQYQSRRNDLVINNDSTDHFDAVATVCARHCEYRVTPVLETSFGLRWDTDLCCGDYGFYLNLAWEQQIWFNHGHLVDLSPNYAKGDLTLQGVTVGAGFSF